MAQKQRQPDKGRTSGIESAPGSCPVDSGASGKDGLPLQREAVAVSGGSGEWLAHVIRKSGGRSGPS